MERKSLEEIFGTATSTSQVQQPGRKSLEEIFGTKTAQPEKRKSLEEIFSTTQKKTVSEQETGLKEFTTDVKQTTQNIKSNFLQGADKIAEINQAQKSGEQGSLSSLFQKFGAGAGAATKSIGDLLTGAVKSVLPQKAEDEVKKGLEKVVTTVLNTKLPNDKNITEFVIKPAIDKYESLKQTNPEAARNLSAFANIAMLATDIYGAGQGTKALKESLKKGVDIGKGASKVISEELNTTIATRVPKTINKLQEINTVKKTPTKALGEVLQGKTSDLKPGLESLVSLDTTGVKNYSDLNKKINSKISQLLKTVDKDLDVDSTKRLVQDFNLFYITEDGVATVSNPVKTAIEQLEELYRKTGDILEQANINTIKKKASTEGLTSSEVNKLARKYGSEFGKKAFSKTGDQLTSVNAQMYENVRSQIKQVARQSLRGAEAKKADELITSLLNTQKLIEKNIEAVNKLKQKIKDRNLLEKVGHAVGKYADVLTGGGLRGVIGGLLPRGVGYKTMNALDIEEILSKNLKIIQNAIDSNDEKQIIDNIKKLLKEKAN